MSSGTQRLDSSEAIVPFPCARADVPTATHIRSTVIASSLSALKERGHYDAYLAQLGPAHRDEILASVAGVWLPIATGVAHYEACDRLRLPASELVALGGHAGDRTMKSPLSVAVKLAKETGVSPWSMFAQARRFWERSFQGSAMGVFKLGPKEARVEIVAWPLSRIEYNRVSMRGILGSLAQPFCARVYVSELAAIASPTTCGFRVAWA